MRGLTVFYSERGRKELSEEKKLRSVFASRKCTVNALNVYNEMIVILFVSVWRMDEGALVMSKDLNFKSFKKTSFASVCFLLYLQTILLRSLCYYGQW